MRRAPSAADHFAMSELRRSRLRVLIAAVVVLLVAAGTLRSRNDGDVQRVRPADPIAGLPEATVEVSARGVETSAAVTGISSLSLDGMWSISISGRLPGEEADPARTFATSQRPLTLRARDIELQTSTLVRPNEVRLKMPAGGRSNVTVRGRVTLVAGEIMSTTSAEPQPVRHRGSVTFIAAGTGELRTGPSRDAPSVRWTDAPKSLRVLGEQRSITDWAGTGTVRVGGQDYTHEFGAFAARRFEATVKREPGKVTVSGRGRAQQVYLDGQPQLWTSATCDLVQIRERTVAGRRLELTWAPRNTGDFDMVMTRIVPIGPAARWLSFGLSGLINEFGGEMRPYRRGDTTGFRGGSPIRSVLPPGDADRRDIGVDVPGGTPNGTYDASVRFEGNFDAVVVPFEVIVVDAADVPRN